MTKSNPCSTELTEAEIKKILRRKYEAKRPPRMPGRPRPIAKYTKEEARRRHIKMLLRERHPGPKLDLHIQRLETRLQLLKEIRDERDGATWGGDVDQGSRKCGAG